MPYIVITMAGLSRWYTCTAPDLQWHLDGHWARASNAMGWRGGLCDMQSLAADDAVIPWGSGYTRRYVMTLLALYLGQQLFDKAHLLKDLKSRTNFLGNRRYDLFGNMFAVQSVIPRPMLTLPAAEKQKAPTSLQVHV